MAKKMNKDFDVARDVVVARMLDMMAQGIIPWKKPWFGMNKCYAYVSGRPYNMLNELMLDEEGAYVTKSQLFKLGGHMLDGETWKDRCRVVVGCFHKLRKIKDADGNVVLDEDGEEKTKTISYLKYWYVVNVKYTDLPTKRRKVYTPPMKSRTAEKVIERYLTESGVKMDNVVGNEACYMPLLDKVIVPRMEQFKEQSEYYSTVFHELGHSTGHPSRENRIDVMDIKFGKEPYAREELVAEFTAAILNNWTGTADDKSDKNSAAYLQNWSKAIKDDPKMFTYAAYKADAAARRILGRENRPVVESTEIEE